MPIKRGEISVAWSAAYELHIPDGDPPSGGWPVLVALHGFGDDGRTMAERLPITSPRYARLWPDGRFPVEVKRDGERALGRAWYQYTGDQDAFRVALDEGCTHLRRLMEHVGDRHPIDLTRAVLLGYSQGGYLAGVAALRDRDIWRGLVALSTRVKTEAVSDGLEGATGFPVLMLHGSRDRFIDPARQEAEAVRLQQLGVAAEFEVFDGGHGLLKSHAPRIDGFVADVLAIQ